MCLLWSVYLVYVYLRGPRRDAVAGRVVLVPRVEWARGEEVVARLVAVIGRVVAAVADGLPRGHRLRLHLEAGAGVGGVARAADRQLGDPGEKRGYKTNNFEGKISLMQYELFFVFLLGKSRKVGFT